VTTLIAWTGVDSRGPASLYLAADSKFSWTQSTAWLHGRKLYASRVVPDILGYCGDVLFATQAVGQVLELVEAELLFTRTTDFASRLGVLHQFVRRSFGTYPAEERRAFSIVYATRGAEGMSSTFSVGEVGWSPATGWTERVAALPERSGVVLVRGSGTAAFGSTLQRWMASDVGGTSRAVFSAFCEHVRSGDDIATGGAPQLVGLYREPGPATTFGVAWEGMRYLSGALVNDALSYRAVEWRDDLFQICDPATLALASGAQPHARPRGV